MGALRVFTKAFEYFDTFKDGTVTLAGLTKVLHDKINALTQLPPSQREKELIAALFAKLWDHANKNWLRHGWAALEARLVT